MLTRRLFGKIAVASVAFPRLASAAADATIAGVRVGVQTYSFRDLPRPANGDAIDGIIKAMVECGLVECELWAPQVEPAQPAGRGRPQAEIDRAREEVRKWRLETPLEHFGDIRRKFVAAGPWEWDC